MANQFTRRDFLRTGTMAGLGMAVGSMALSSCTSSKARSDAASMIGYNPGAKDLIKVGFAGIGNTHRTYPCALGQALCTRSKHRGFASNPRLRFLQLLRNI